MAVPELMDPDLATKPLIFFWVSGELHFGHSGVEASEIRRNFSNTCPHFSQANSYIGMIRPLYIVILPITDRADAATSGRDSQTRQQPVDDEQVYHYENSYFQHRTPSTDICRVN